MSGIKGKRLKLLGKRFGKLVVLSCEGLNPRNNVIWKCLCDCGKEKIIPGSSLMWGVKSCGCLQKEVRSKMSLTHGLSHTKEYRIWMQMIQRCGNEKSKSFHNYGGRGIVVCEEWLNSFESFIRDVGPRPSSRHSLDRIDNDGNYKLGNVKWSTYSENNKNRRELKCLNNFSTEELKQEIERREKSVLKGIAVGD